MTESKQIKSKLIHRFIAVMLIAFGLQFFYLTYWIGTNLNKNFDKVMSLIGYSQLTTAVKDLDHKLETAGDVPGGEEVKNNEEFHNGLHQLYHLVEESAVYIFNVVILVSVLIGTFCLLGGLLIIDLLRVRKE